MEQKQPLEVFWKNGVLKNSQKFAGKHLCQSFCFNLLKEFLTQVFSVNFGKFLRTPIFKNNSRQPLLKELATKSYKHTMKLVFTEINVKNWKKFSEGVQFFKTCWHTACKFTNYRVKKMIGMDEKYFSGKFKSFPKSIYSLQIWLMQWSFQIGKNWEKFISN